MLDWTPITLSLKLAAITTLWLLVISIPLAYWLAFTRSRIAPLIDAIVSLPLVLPPTVLGFYLLALFSPNTAFGEKISTILGFDLVFSFSGLVVGSIIYSLPFMVHPVRSAFSNFPRSLIDASDTLGQSRAKMLYRILLPNIRPALITGIVLSFAHTLGEFGVVLMIGGSIPGSTKVASIAVYEAVEMLDYDNANAYALILIALCFVILLSVYVINKSAYNFFGR